MIPGRRLLLVAATAALIGCGSAADDRPAKWSFISASITEPSCATVNCHSAVAQRAGVDLHDRASGYAALVAPPIGRNFVIPGDTTSSSAILFLLDGNGSIRMPPDSPLPKADRELINDWIMAGAPND